MTNATVSSSTAPARSGKGLNVVLWIIQVLLALLFGFAGMMKLVTPIAELAKNAEWITSSPGLVRFIGVSEVAGALGLLLPALTRIMPKLTPLAAAGLAVIMLLASAFHVARGEMSHVPLTVIIGALAVFVAWGRSRRAPLAESNKLHGPRPLVDPLLPPRPLL